VQAAIQAARGSLPTSLPNKPTYRKVNPADAPVMILALTSERYNRGQLYDIASTNLAQRVSQVKGVGQVSVGGGSLPAVRVELNPTLLNKLSIGFDDVRTAITNTNANRPKGVLDDGERAWQVQANDQAKKAEEYKPIIVAWRNGAPVRLGDLGEVVDSVQDIRNYGMANGKPAVLMIINRQPDANIIEVVDAITNMIPFLQETVPAGVDLQVMMERTSTIRASLRDVERTLLISVALVVLVVFVFLRDWRAHPDPGDRDPDLARGHVRRHVPHGLQPQQPLAHGAHHRHRLRGRRRHRRARERLAPHRGRHGAVKAALQGAREVAFTVVSMSVSLVAVFIRSSSWRDRGAPVPRVRGDPVPWRSGSPSWSSLSTTPMMCSRLLRRAADRKQDASRAGASAPSSRCIAATRSRSTGRCACRS
jgi:multidrug efflux pump